MTDFKRGPIPEENECEVCPLAVEGKPNRPVRGIGPEYPSFLIVGEGPGVQEIREGLPFVGTSGRLLNRALHSVNIKRDDVWVTNSTMCLPPRDAKEEMVERARECCKPRLLREIDDRGPDPPILAVGKHATQSLLGKRIGGKELKITDVTGTFHTISLEGIPFTKDVIPTIHPAAILRGEKSKGKESSGGAHATDLLYWFLQYDIAKIGRLASGEVKPFTDDITIYHEETDRAKTLELVKQLYEDAKTIGFLACDLETDGTEECTDEDCYDCGGKHSALDAMKARINAIGLAVPDHGIAVSWDIMSNEARAFLRDVVFTDNQLTIYFHNRAYDEIVLHANGFPLKGPVGCTLFLHHNVFPGLPHKLQRVASQFFLIGPWKAEYRAGELFDIVEHLKYNARDTLVTARLVRPLLKLLETKSAQKTYAMDMRKQNMAKWMQLWGVPYDIDRLTLMRDYFTPKVLEAQGALLGRIKDPAFKENFKKLLTLEQARFTRKKDSLLFEERQEKRLQELDKKWNKAEEKGQEFLNFNSTPQLVAYLKACGVNLTQVTKKGKLSTKKDVLEALVGYPAVQELLQYRANEKLLSTFILTVPRMLDSNHRLHPEWIANKMSGRFGSSPNHQNFSKGKTSCKTWEDWAEAARGWLDGLNPDPGIPNLRWLVVAPKGRKLVGADYKALEARLIAMLSGDDWLCNMFIGEGDLHSYFAELIFPDFKNLSPKDSRRKSLRDLVKRAEYGYLYGAAILTVWAALAKEGENVPISTINNMFRIFEQKMPKIAKYYGRLLREVATNGRVRSFLYGRSRYFPLGNIDESAIKNAVCQYGGADIADTGIVRVFETLQERFPNAMMLIHGHDAGTVECDEGDSLAVSQLLIECMTQEYTYEGAFMRFSVDADIGSDWAST